MNILVTGISGFVGRNFLEFLKNNQLKYNILALTRGSRNSNINNVTWLDYPEDFNEIFRKFSVDIVLHLAGKAHDTRNTTEAGEYFKVNTELTQKLFTAFSNSDATKFIFLSTIKAAGDDKTYIENASDLTEPQTPYALSKRQAEIFIQNYDLPKEKSFYILRPCLIYGPSVKGNLATLIRFVKKGIPYPFASFDNKRSYLSVRNLCFIFQKIAEGNYPSFTLNIANEDPVGTQELLEILTAKAGKRNKKLFIPETIIKLLASAGDLLPLSPFNSEKLRKITSSLVVDTSEMNRTLGFRLPEKTRETLGDILS